MAKSERPLSAEAQCALGLLVEAGDGDWFILDAMEVVSCERIQAPYVALKELGQAGLGQIYDGSRRFKLTKSAAASVAEQVSHGDEPPPVDESGDEGDSEETADRVTAQEAAVAAAAGEEAAADTGDDLEPVDAEDGEGDGLSDEDIAALAGWKRPDDNGTSGRSDRGAARSPGQDHFPKAALVDAVLVELLGLQLARQEGIPGDPSGTIYGRLTTGPGRKDGVSAHAVREAIAYCKERGWLQRYRDVMLRLAPRARLIAFRLASGRFSELGRDTAYEYDNKTGTLKPVE